MKQHLVFYRIGLLTVILSIVWMGTRFSSNLVESSPSTAAWQVDVTKAHSTGIFTDRNPKIDSEDFEASLERTASLRSSRLITVDQFIESSQDANTIVIDPRSPEAYDKLHIQGAINLNLTDITDDVLGDIIPNPDTRILIYGPESLDRLSRQQASDEQTAQTWAYSLSVTMFSVLLGYGYTNVWELDPSLDATAEDQIVLGGTSVSSVRPKCAANN